MGKYDFEKMIDRRNSDSEKWAVPDNELPMWVADMDFEVVPEVKEALHRRVEQGIYGYPSIPKEWAAAYRNWWRERHHVKIDEKWLLFGLGVNFINSSIIKRFTNAGDGVVLLSPVYVGFYHIIRGSDRNAVESRLIYDKAHGTWEIDFDDLKEKLSREDVKLMLVCNPHNPVGRILSSIELEKIAGLCKEQGVVMISDEIHCDITDPGKEYVSALSLDEELKKNLIVAISPTKAFNLAGLQSAAAVVPDEGLRKRVYKALSADEINVPNMLSADAAIAAFTYGKDWLKEFNDYIYENKKAVSEYIEKNLPLIRLTNSDSTYLLWLDCEEYKIKATELSRRLREEAGLYLNSGETFGSGGEYFLRMNIACPRERLLDGLLRLKKGLDAIKSTCNNCGYNI